MTLHRHLLSKLPLLLAIGVIFHTSCGTGNNGRTSPSDRTGNDDWLAGLAQDIATATADEPGQCGVAIIIDNKDTVAFNNRADYPMMSMFKLHEALAVCATLDTDGISLDSLLSIKREELNAGTWSPMLKKYPDGNLQLPVSELLRYLLVDSDNNASNLLFDKIISPAETDSVVQTIIPGMEFKIEFTESEMQRDHGRSYSNRTSPLAYAALVNRVFTDNVVSREKQNFIKQCMADCNTGMERIAAPLAKHPEVSFAHRTGSGYVNERGEVIAVNDGGYVSLPSGRNYSIAVFVKDYAGDQEDAERLIACISETVYNHLAD
jgi:beta-lactamase class A